MPKPPDAIEADTDVGPEDEPEVTETEGTEQPDATEAEDETETPDDVEDPESPDEPEPQPVAAPQPRASRENDRVRKAVERAQRAEADAAAARVRLEELERQRQGTTTAQEDANERERVALMTDGEKFDYYRRKDQEAHRREIGIVRFEASDRADKAAFDRLCDKTPALADYADAVEAELSNLRRTGVNLSREHVAYALLGQSAVKRAPAARARQAKSGAGNIQRERANPQPSRSDKGRTSRSDDQSEDALERRLASHKF